MKLAGRRELPFPREAVWDALMDPEVLSRTLPGCERLERTGESAFAGTLTVQVGPVRGTFDGTLELTDLRPPGSYRMKLHGEGPSGFLTGEGEVKLEETEAGTAVLYDLDAQVGGRIAGVGQRLLDSSAKVIARQGLDGLERQLRARHGAPATPEPAAPAPHPERSEGSHGPAPRRSLDRSAPREDVQDRHPERSEAPPRSADEWPSAHELAPPPTAVPVAPPSPPPLGRPERSEGPQGSRTEPPPARPATDSSTPEYAPAPTQREFALGFLRGLWEETVPPAARPWVVAGAVLVLALLRVLLLSLILD